MAKPKLTLIPAAFGTKLYSVLPSTGVGDFTFTRASSATRIARTGYIETVASGNSRLDYQLNTGGTVQECPHYLLEPARTNVLLQSNQFDTTWINTNTTITSGYLGLDGSNSAWLLTKTANTFANIKQNITFSGIHTFSVYLKKGTNTSAILRTTGGVLARFEINLIDGTTIAESSTLSVKTESMGNDWWRCSMTFQAASDTSVRIYPEAPLGGTTAGNIYMQYAQLEQGSYPTSYIPTSGTSVTRSAETATDSGNSEVFNDSEGLLYIESRALDNTILLNRKIVLGDGTLSNGVEFSYQTSNNKMQFIIRSGGSISLGIETSVFDVTEFTKIAIQYKLNEGKVFVNGNQIGATYTNIVSPTINRLDLKFGNGFNFEGKVKEIRVYDEALTDEELASLTTI